MPDARPVVSSSGASGVVQLSDGKGGFRSAYLGTALLGAAEFTGDVDFGSNSLTLNGTPITDWPSGSAGSPHAVQMADGSGGFADTGYSMSGTDLIAPGTLRPINVDAAGTIYSGGGAASLDSNGAFNGSKLNISGALADGTYSTGSGGSITITNGVITAIS